jgi:hypothetical protein
VIACRTDVMQRVYRCIFSLLVLAGIRSTANQGFKIRRIWSGSNLQFGPVSTEFTYNLPKINGKLDSAGSDLFPPAEF